MSQLTSLGSFGGGSTVLTLTGNAGGAVSPTAGNINILGTGAVNITGAGSTLTVSISGVQLAWVEVLGASQAMSANTGYVTKNVGLTTFSMPAVPAFGDRIRIAGFGLGGWTIDLASSGQSISYLNTTSVSSISSSYFTDSIEILCVDATAKLWTTISSLGALSIP